MSQSNKVTREALYERITFIRRTETLEKSDYGKGYLDAIQDCFSAFEIIPEEELKILFRQSVFR